mgnify:CR=1 FL=1
MVTGALSKTKMRQYTKWNGILEDILTQFQVVLNDLVAGFAIRSRPVAGMVEEAQNRFHS